MSPGQYRRIIHAIPDHGHYGPLGLQGMHGLEFDTLILQYRAGCAPIMDHGDTGCGAGGNGGSAAFKQQQGH